MTRGSSIRRTVGAAAVLFVVSVGTVAADVVGVASPTTASGRSGAGSGPRSTGRAAGSAVAAVPAQGGSAAGPAAVAPVPPPPAAPLAAPPPQPAPGEVAIVPPPEQFEAPAPPPVPPPPALVEPPPPEASTAGAGTWAVIIGIDDYPGSGRDLRSAVNDADDVDRALSAMNVPADRRLVLRDGQAGADRIREAVEWLVSRAGPDATAVFFYAGHVRKLGATTEALVAADGGLVGDRELGERLARLPARRAWVAIAACYGGGFTELLAPGRVLTGAAGANSLAYENADLGRSYLVHYMVREAMIENRAAQSVQAAFAYAAAALARQHPNRQPVQIDQAGIPLDLRQAPPLPLPPIPTPAAPAIPPVTPTTAPCRQLLILTCRS